METIHSYIRLLWYISKIQSHIEGTKKDAKSYHDKVLPELQKDPNTICLYTDGSGIDKRIGAAVYCSTVQTTKQQHMGSETEYNVFAAELTAILLATEIVRANPSHNRCEIFTDSQPSIKALLKPRKQSGQSIINAILDNIENLHTERPALTFTITWIPGHMDIDENEEADKAAKAAAKSNGSERTQAALKSARNAANKMQTRDK